MVLRNWPLTHLRVVTPVLELVYPDDHVLDALADIAAAGVHDASSTPFLYPWTDVDAPQQQRNTLQHHWKARSEHRPDSWTLGLGVLVDGEPIGVQGVLATDFALLRSVDTGSWLGRAHQGRGLGTEMRAAVLHLAFAGLDAVEANSGAYTDNAASQAVSRKLGYEVVGERRMRRRDEADRMLLLRLTRERWERQRRDDITIIGLERCLDMLV